MGAFLAKPQTSKHTDSGSGNGLRYGLSSMQGWRVEMEDAHCAAVRLQPPSMADWSFFAIFDGHAGARVSALCAEQLLESIVSNDDFRADATPGGAATWQPSSESVQRGIKTGFLRLDASMRKLPEVESGEDKSGSTAVCCLVSPRHIFFGNCGDSRAVLSRAGQVVFATRDHKPADPEERARIQNAGGSVMLQRVNGSLAVSRALGDYDYKNVAGRGPCEQLVSPEPEVSVEERATRDDEFAVLACDGIWDVMSNEELAAFVRDRMRLTDDLAHVCNQVVDTCLYKGSRDNMSIVIIAFEGAPAVSLAAQACEVELDRRLETKVKELLEKEEPPDAALLPYVMHLLSAENIDGLPPGGGLSAKRTTIEKIVNQIVPTKATESD